MGGRARVSAGDAVPILLVVLLVGVLAYMWVVRRGLTLTRDCRWRLDRTVGVDHWRCAACGAAVTVASGKRPKDCLRPRD